MTTLVFLEHHEGELLKGSLGVLSKAAQLGGDVAGAILGNLDEDIKNFFGSHEPIIVPFMAFTLGQTINLKSAATAGIPGIVLGLTVLTVTGFVCIVADKLLGGTGIAGAAASSTAGNSATVPQAVALADTSYAPVAGAATVQVAASVIVTAILTPFLTSWWFKRVAKERNARAALCGSDASVDLVARS